MLPTKWSPALSHWAVVGPWWGQVKVSKSHISQVRSRSNEAAMPAQRRSKPPALRRIAPFRLLAARHAHEQPVARASCPRCFQLLGALVAEWPHQLAANHSAGIGAPDRQQCRCWSQNVVVDVESPIQNLQSESVCEAMTSESHAVTRHSLFAR